MGFVAYNTISQTLIEHYNEFINVIIEALRWVKMTIDTGINFKVVTSCKERDRRLLDFINIDKIKIEQNHPSSQDIINLLMIPNINSSFKKHLM